MGSTQVVVVAAEQFVVLQRRHKEDINDEKRSDFNESWWAGAFFSPLA